MKGFILNAEVVAAVSPTVGRAEEESSATSAGERQTKEAKDETQFYGIREDGKAFVWKESDPYLIAFYLPAANEEGAFPPPGVLYRRLKNRFKDYYQQPVEAFFFNSQRALSEALKLRPAQFLEKNVNAASRFLMEKKIKGLVHFESPPQQENATLVRYENPTVRAVKVPPPAPSFTELGFPALRVLSLDIETGVSENKLYSIALYHPSYSKVFMLAGPKSVEKGVVETSAFYTCYENEKALLQAFLAAVKQFNPQLFIGWNVAGFDFKFLVNKFEEHRLPFTLGLADLPVVSYTTARRREPVIKIPGRAIVEGMEVVKAMGITLKSYSLDSVAEAVLGKKKLINLKGLEKVQEIERQFREEREELAKYNLEDAKLVYALLERLQGVEFQVQRTLSSGVLLERLSNQNEVLDQLYLPELHRHFYVAPNSNRSRSVPLSRSQREKTFSAGVFQAVFQLQFRFLFPVIISAYKLDPLGLVAAGWAPQAAFHTPRGFAFHKELHLLPALVKRLLAVILQSKATSLAARVAEAELKNVLLALHSPTGRHNLTGLYEALMENANYVVEKTVEELRRVGFDTVYYDNEIMVVKALSPAPGADRDRLQRELIRLEKEFFPALLNCQSGLLQLHLKNYFPHFFLYAATLTAPFLRERSRGEYVAVNESGALVEQVNFYELSELAREFEFSIIKALFENKKKVEQAIKTFRSQLFQGTFDALLFFQKKLNKPLEEYESHSTLPQVVAAFKKRTAALGKRATEGGAPAKPFFSSREMVSYAMTKAGPEPREARSHPFDYSYYLEKVIGNSAQRVLNFPPYQELIEIAKNKNTQLELF